MLARTLLTLGLCMVLAACSAAEVAVYTPATIAPGMSPAPNTFEPFNPAKIPGRVDVPEPSFRAQFAYAGSDWEVYDEPPKPGRRPRDPTRFQHIVLLHRSVPAGMSISFEHVESTSDADPVTLAKILRYNREGNAKFRLLGETNRSVDGVDGAQAEYVQLRKKKLMRVRHWTAHYNGIVYQLELVVPYEHPELLQLGGTQGFPMLVRFSDRARNRPLLKDDAIPRSFASPYGFRVELGDGEWIPYGQDPYISLAEYAAYTRNQGGIAVVPLSTLGENLGPAALLEAVVWLAELPTKDMMAPPRRVVEGNLQGITFETLCGDEEEMIRARAKAICSSNHAYLAVAWINTNSPLGPEVLDQWLNKISFAQDAAFSTWPASHFPPLRSS